MIIWLKSTCVDHFTTVTAWSWPTRFERGILFFAVIKRARFFASRVEGRAIARCCQNLPKNEMIKVWVILNTFQSDQPDLCNTCSVTRFGEISPLRQQKSSLFHFFEGSISLWQNFQRILANFYAIGQIFIFVNG